MNCEDEFRERNYLNPEIKEMFFALDLIESYGSGIRRAKNAMKANGSPNLVFEPENDTDDYTMVTAYINEEFKKIQQEEQGLGSEKVSDTTQYATQLNNQDDNNIGIKEWSGTETKILHLLVENPNISQSSIAKELDMDINNVKYYIKKFKKMDVVVREGNQRTGKWVVRM